MDEMEHALVARSVLPAVIKLSECHFDFELPYRAKRPALTKRSLCRAIGKGIGGGGDKGVELSRTARLSYLGFFLITTITAGVSDAYTRDHAQEIWV